MLEFFFRGGKQLLPHSPILGEKSYAPGGLIFGFDNARLESSDTWNSKHLSLNKSIQNFSGGIEETITGTFIYLLRR